MTRWFTRCSDVKHAVNKKETKKQRNKHTKKQTTFYGVLTFGTFNFFFAFLVSSERSRETFLHTSHLLSGKIAGNIYLKIEMIRLYYSARSLTSDLVVTVLLTNRILGASVGHARCRHAQRAVGSCPQASAHKHQPIS